MRRRIYEIIEGNNYPTMSIAYNTIMIIAIIVSIIPLMFKEQFPVFQIFELFGCSIFIIDYILRWITADYKSNKCGISTFLSYPITAWAILDLLTILPSFNIINRGIIMFRVIRLAKIVRVLRLFKWTSHFDLITKVLKSEASVLANVLGLCLIYIFLSALIMFNYEESMKTFLDALYWATTALTTVEYGDVCPTSNAGKIISMISSLFGIAIVALPSGIITARYLDELEKQKKK